MRNPFKPNRLSAAAAAVSSLNVGPAESVVPKMSRAEFEEAMKQKLDETRIEDALSHWVHHCAEELVTLGVDPQRSISVAMAVYQNGVTLGTIKREFQHWPVPGDAARAHMLANPDEADTP